MCAVFRIANGQFYEAHQSVRTVVNRYVRSKSYTEAIHLLYTSSELLLKAGEGGSGCDLVLYLLSTYELASVSVDATSRARLLKLLNLIPPTEPDLKKVAKEITAWSSKRGDGTPLGDPELHHVLGVKFAQADEAYEAEKHLLVGTKDSPAVLAQLLYEWYEESGDNDDDDVKKESGDVDEEEEEEEETRALRAPQFLSRAVFGYLSIENIRDALEVTRKYIELLKSSRHRDGTAEYTFDSEIAKADGISVCSELPLLNFLQLLIITCQFKSADMFKRLQNRYSNEISDLPAWTGPMAQIAQQYFGIAPQRSNNMLQDLLGSFMMPGQGGAGGAGNTRSLGF